MENGQLIMTKTCLELPTIPGAGRGRQLRDEALFLPLGRTACELNFKKAGCRPPERTLTKRVLAAEVAASKIHLRGAAWSVTELGAGAESQPDPVAPASGRGPGTVPLGVRERASKDPTELHKKEVYGCFP